MAKLIEIALPEADAKSRSNIQAVAIEGDAVTRFNDARDQIDKATEVINEIQPVLREAGLKAVFTHNCEHAVEPKALISSVNLTDDEGEVVQFSWTKKDLKNNSKAVSAEFDRVRNLQGKKVDKNAYVGYEVAATFDTDVFMVSGTFNMERYEAFMTALNEVSAVYQVPNPLTCGKVLKPKADFHARRWQDFDLDTNLQLQMVLPTQVNLKPLRPEAA